MSEQARIYRSFSGTCLTFFLVALEGGIVTVMVAIVNESPRSSDGTKEL